MVPRYCKNLRGWAHINTINNEDNNFLFDTLEWLNNQKNVAIKTAIEKWPDEYKFIAELSLWFEQITDAIRDHPPEDNVRRVIVKENIHGDAVGVDYEYYPKNDSLIGIIAFRTTTVDVKNDNFE